MIVVVAHRMNCDRACVRVNAVLEIDREIAPSIVEVFPKLVRKFPAVLGRLIVVILVTPRDMLLLEISKKHSCFDRVSPIQIRWRLPVDALLAHAISFQSARTASRSDSIASNALWKIRLRGTHGLPACLG